MTLALVLLSDITNQIKRKTQNLTATAWENSNFERHIPGHTKCSHEEMQYFLIRNFAGLVKEPTSKDNILDIILTSNAEIINKVWVTPWIRDHDMVC